MELQQIQGNARENVVQLLATGIHKQANRRHKSRQGRNDIARLLDRHRTWTLGVKHQTDRISARFGGDQCVFYAGNTADLAANDGQNTGS